MDSRVSQLILTVNDLCEWSFTGRKINARVAFGRRMKNSTWMSFEFILQQKIRSFPVNHELEIPNPFKINDLHWKSDSFLRQQKGY